MKLGDVTTIKVGMSDADFWLVRHAEVKIW